MGVEQYYMPIMIGVMVTLFLLCIFLIIRTVRKHKKQANSIKEFLLQKRSDRDDHIAEIKSAMEKLEFPDERIDDVIELYINNEKEYYIDLIEVVANEDYSKLDSLDEILRKHVTSMMDKITLLQVEISEAATESAQTEVDAEESDDTATDGEQDDEADTNVEADLETDDIDALLAETQESDEADGEDIVVDGSNDDAKSSESDAISIESEAEQSGRVKELEEEIERLEEEVKVRTEKETEIRALLDDVLAEFCAMFNIARDSIASMSPEEIREMVLGSKK